MNYSPLFDQVVTGIELIVLGAVVVTYVFDAIFWRRCADMFRRGGKWGGE
ncbi:MAG: hypothetical protein KGL39_43175 [Patescibacteria group bacterium]|nr:hypothetical protein [Patescibacteria group bacterium]